MSDGTEQCLCLPCQARRAHFVLTEKGFVAWNVRDVFFYNMPCANGVTARKLYE